MKQTIGNQGFTLIEILIASVIFTVVITSVYGAYRITFNNINNTEKTLYNSTLGQNALAFIAKDLENISFEQDTLFLAQKDSSASNTGTISFHTSNRLISHPNESASAKYTVSYTIEKDENSELVKLYRDSGKAYLDEERNKTVRYLLIDQLEKIIFTFYNNEGEEFTEWEKTEKKDTNIPAMVRIELYFPTDYDNNEPQFLALNVALPKRK